jgi:NADPH-dependent curcumin reductase CurA
MRAFSVGEVEQSNNPDYAVGDKVMGIFGWQDYAAVSPKQVMRKVLEHDLPLSLSLGVLGLNGLTGYFGVREVLHPRAGETVVVSTAAGGVGSAAGQIAKIMGCRVVGITGGAEKVRQCLEEFGYDAAIDYKSGSRCWVLDGNSRKPSSASRHPRFFHRSPPIPGSCVKGLTIKSTPRKRSMPSGDRI